MAAIQIEKFGVKLFEKLKEGKNKFFVTFSDLNETFIFMSKFSIGACPQLKYVILYRKKGHFFSYQVPKRPKL